MFAKSKVSQSMIDAVNKVLGEQPVQPAQPVQPVGVKEELLNEGWDDMVKDAKEKMKSGPKPSGGAGKKEGSRYGGSKQKDEKEPVKEELTDKQKKNIDKNKNNRIDSEDFKILRKEELKGNQGDIDANHNNEIDRQDFAILRGKKKKMREHLNDMPFAKKLLEKELDEGLMKKAFKALTGGSDEDQRKDLQRKMGVPQTGKKPESEIKYAAKTLVKHAKDPLGLKKEEADITTDGLDGRKDGGAENTFNLFKKKLQGDVGPNPKGGDKPEETAARKSHNAKPTNSQSPQEVDNLDKKYGTPNTFKEEKEEPPFDKPYTKTKNFPVTDKSGAIHTPMSRARDLAQSALKKVKDKTKIKN